MLLLVVLVLKLILLSFIDQASRQASLKEPHLTSSLTVAMDLQIERTLDRNLDKDLDNSLDKMLDHVPSNGASQAPLLDGVDLTASDPMWPSSPSDLATNKTAAPTSLSPGTPIEISSLRTTLMTMLRASPHLVLNNYTRPLCYFEAQLARLPTEPNEAMAETLDGLVGPSDGQACFRLDETVLHPDLDLLPSTILASFPRTGNSWLRSLVEKAIGYGTSSMYCDTRLAFRWECESNNRFLMKTHYPHKFDSAAQLAVSEARSIRWRKYDRCIYLVRNPFDAFMSYFMYQRAKGNHVQKARHFPHAFFQKAQVSRMLARFKTHWHYWMAEAQLPNLVLRYEDLKRDPLCSMLKVYLFLLSAPSPVGLPSFTNPSVLSLRLIHSRLLCAIKDDLAHVSGILYKTHKYAVGHSLPYFQPATIRYIKDELASFFVQFNY